MIYQNHFQKVSEVLLATLVVYSLEMIPFLENNMDVDSAFTYLLSL